MSKEPGVYKVDQRLHRVAWLRLLHLGRDILFTFVLPYALLSPHSLHLPALPVSSYWAYVLAGLLPSLYLLLDTLRRGSVNPFGVFLLVGSLSNALVSFWRLDGVYFALKDASHSLLLIVVCCVSIALRRPLFEFLFYGLLAPETPQRQWQLTRALRRADIRPVLGWATACVALKAAVLAVISYAVARLVVMAPFGAPQFNAQVARAHAITFPVYLLLDALFYGMALWLTLQAMRRLTGGRAWPWQEGFWAALDDQEGTDNAHG